MRSAASVSGLSISYKLIYAYSVHTLRIASIIFKIISLARVHSYASRARASTGGCRIGSSRDTRRHNGHPTSPRGWHAAKQRSARLLAQIGVLARVAPRQVVRCAALVVLCRAMYLVRARGHRLRRIHARVSASRVERGIAVQTLLAISTRAGKFGARLCCVAWQAQVQVNCGKVLVSPSASSPSFLSSSSSRAPARYRHRHQRSAARCERERCRPPPAGGEATKLHLPSLQEIARKGSRRCRPRQQWQQQELHFLHSWSWWQRAGYHRRRDHGCWPRARALACPLQRPIVRTALLPALDYRARAPGPHSEQRSATEAPHDRRPLRRCAALKPSPCPDPALAPYPARARATSVVVAARTRQIGVLKRSRRHPRF